MASASGMGFGSSTRARRSDSEQTTTLRRTALGCVAFGSQCRNGSARRGRPNSPLGQARRAVPLVAMGVGAHEIVIASVAKQARANDDTQANCPGLHRLGLAMTERGDYAFGPSDSTGGWAARRRGASLVMMLRDLNSGGLAQVRYSIRPGSPSPTGHQGKSR